jgi:hypothetical protein
MVHTWGVSHVIELFQKIEMRKSLFLILTEWFSILPRIKLAIKSQIKSEIFNKRK